MFNDQIAPHESAQVSNRALILKETQSLSAGNPYGFPMTSTDAVDPTGRAFTFSKLFHAFRRRWLLASFVGILLGASGFSAIYALMPDSYDVQSLLRFNYDSIYLVGRSNGGLDIDRNVFRDTQKQLLTSDVVISLALGEVDDEQRPISTLPMLNGEKDPKQIVRQAISVVNPIGTDLLSVRMRGRDPKQLVKILDALIKSFVKYQNEEEIRPISTTIAKLKKEYDDSTLQYKTLSDIIANERRLNQDPNEESSRRQLDLLRTDLATNEGLLRQLQNERSGLARSIETNKYFNSEAGFAEVPEVMLESLYADYPSYAETKAKIGEAKKNLADHKAYLVNHQNNPKIVGIERQIQELEKQLAEERIAAKPFVVAKVRASAPGQALPLPVLENNLRALDVEIAAREKSMNDYRERYTQLTAKSSDMENRKRDLEAIDVKIRKINSAREEMDVRQKGLKDTPRIVELSKPEVPAIGNVTTRTIMSIFIGLVGLIGGIAGVVLLENRKYRVNTVDEVASPGPGMKVLGTVPNLGRLRGRGNDVASSVLAESIDTLRTILLQGKNKNLVRAVLVTSAGEGESKTTVATHLAASLARCGKKTLLIDGDVRKPTIHLLFNLPQQAGLCELLRGEIAIDDAVQPAELEGMYLLQAGICDHTALATLAKDHALDLFSKLRSVYDYIVIDSGPVLGYADALLLGGYADAAIMTVLRDVSRLPSVYEAREQLESVGIPVLGAVVGRV